MTTFVLATANPDKAEEIESVLRSIGLPITLELRDPTLPEVVESGATLEDNARLKAVDSCARTGHPAIADDTGLEVDALGGAPGVRTARYAGEDASHADNVQLLLERMRDVPDDRRTARFATVAIARWPDGREVAAHGAVDGRIIAEPRGSGGFGYDPVFVPDDGDGRTFAEMSLAEKDTCSHRARAFHSLADGLRAILEHP